MKFFIDTANLDQIAQAQAMGILDGVTTNPSLMAKEGITGHDNILEHYRKICRLVPGGAISAEVLATDYSHMVSEGRELAGLDPQIVVKVPITEDGLRAIKTFHDEGIQTNCTLVFSAAQALLAAKAGADRVELYTKPYADLYERDPERAVAPYVEAARAARKAGLGINAGHDLSLKNLRYFKENVPHINEVSIGHALICDALYLGLEETIRQYKACLK